MRFIWFCLLYTILLPLYLPYRFYKFLQVFFSFDGRRTRIVRACRKKIGFVGNYLIDKITLRHMQSNDLLLIDNFDNMTAEHRKETEKSLQDIMITNFRGAKWLDKKARKYGLQVEELFDGVLDTLELKEEEKPKVKHVKSSEVEEVEIIDGKRQEVLPAPGEESGEEDEFDEEKY